MGEAKWILVLFIILFAAWVATGGPSSMTRHDQFIEEPAPIQNGQTYNVNDLKEKQPSLFH